jgi:predicted O-methyltransferase YrrM
MNNVPNYFSGGLAEHKNFINIFEEKNYFKDKYIKILHLGAYDGYGTKWMLERVNGECTDVDVWRQPDETIDSSISVMYYKEFYNDSNVEDVYNYHVSGLPTTKFKGTTKDFFIQNKDTFDFIYIDASHKKSDVALDLEESWKILKPGGIIGCDDLMWHRDDDPELIPFYAIREFEEKHSKEITVLIDNYQFWFQKINNA